MKRIIVTKGAPEPIGPYSQAVLHGETLYTSGQIAIDPDSGNLLKKDIESETRRVMKNLEAVLNEAKMDFSNVVKCTIFINNMDDFGKINKVYGSYFDPVTAPARETVEVSRLPKDVRVEISCIAVK
jgi:2-iminobutanoate/2-iminopropanoate deaminase